MSTPTIRDEPNFLNLSKQIVPKITLLKRKGEYGRVGIIGGSKEYTGAPYFAAISALKVGADLVYVFCTKDSSTVIKSYSPELIVHPVLDAEDAVEYIEKMLNRLHVVIIGPGLGRDPKIMETVKQIIGKCRALEKPLVIDADGLFIVANCPDVIRNYPLAVLTPNAMEYSRIFKVPVDASEEVEVTVQKLRALGENIIIVRKAQVDSIFDCENVVGCTAVGSGRRCGGQGDLLSGSLGTFLSWALTSDIILEGGTTKNLKAMIAAYGACRLTRECNAKAFAKLGRSMTTTDMIQEISVAFREVFEKS
ncbi:ATP-dependent (S)-NAD(P)H-hydrate dehydratase [Chrysoperla carnea]|uniref:ATP-dependent (S)-NAD(P)H-hydrate dehydratase n=1 Tax=Chrysoperla carnea TaxID=189513 RepID=UPI001D08218A|nr:ATP-dependent (S)-NAD(P)H-hydrate dehydratase [Chrysoperla carnea]